MRATIDSAGSVVIPKPVRGGAIVVEPAPRKVKLVRKGSLLVAVASPGEEPLTHAQTASAIRGVRAESARR